VADIPKSARGLAQSKTWWNFAAGLELAAKRRKGRKNKNAFAPSVFFCGNFREGF